MYQHDGAEQPVYADDNRLGNHVQHVLHTKQTTDFSYVPLNTIQALHGQSLGYYSTQNRHNLSLAVIADDQSLRRFTHS